MKSTRITITLVAIVLALIGGGASVVFLWGIYTRHWDGNVTNSIVRSVLVPAARVGKRTILYRDYLDSVKSIEIFLQSPEAVAQGVNRELLIADQKSAFDRLLEEAALEELAVVRNINISDEQIAQFTQLAINDFAGQSGKTAADIEPYLMETYGWTLAHFQKHIVRPALLTRLLMTSFSVDHPDDPVALDVYIEKRLAEQDIVRYVKFPADLPAAPTT